MLQFGRGEQRERDGDVDDDGRLLGARPHTHRPGTHYPVLLLMNHTANIV